MGAKKQIMQGLSKWIDSKVNELAKDNIWMALASSTIKRVANEWISLVIPIDMVELLLSNHGVVDANVLADELIQALKNAPEVEKEINGVLISLKSGVISIELPSNSIVLGLLNGNNVLNFRESDIKELAQYINESKLE